MITLSLLRDFVRFADVDKEQDIGKIRQEDYTCNHSNI